VMKQEVIQGEDPYCCNLSKEVQEVAKVELNETAKVRKKALAEVRKWIRSQPQIKRARLDANFILRFLRMQKFEIKESCEILDKYLTMRCQYPTWFQNLDCQDPALADLVSRGYIFVLPERDQHGRRVIFSRAAAFDPTKYTTSDMMRAVRSRLLLARSARPTNELHCWICRGNPRVLELLCYKPSLSA